MVVELVSSADQAMMFSLLTLYMAGSTIFATAHGDAEKPGLFVFGLQGPDYDSQLSAL